MVHYKSLCDLPGPAYKDDAGKPRFSLIPPKAERSVAEVLTFGAEKYDACERSGKGSRLLLAFNL